VLSYDPDGVAERSGRFYAQVVTASFRELGFADLRDAMEDAARVNLSDEELSERGLPLATEDTLYDGLGPSRFVILELETGEQYLLHRLVEAPFDGVFIVTTITADADALTNRLLDGLDIPRERVSWRVGKDHWDAMVAAYRAGGKAAWELRQQGRSGD
jgi:hypothetical protein